MVDVLQILEDFPLLVPFFDFKEWNGIITVEDEEVSVSIAVPNFPSIENISLMCPLIWKSKLHNKLKTFESSTTRKNNFLQLLQYLKTNEHVPNCEIKAADNGVLQSVTSLHIYARVLDELRQVGADNVVGCSADLSCVTLHTVDGRGVDHRVMVGLPSDYPTSPASILDANLPDVALSHLSQARTIIEIFTSFESLIQSLQDFWNVYEELKNNTWIIEPENPQLRDTHIRIIIGENISMLVSLNPQDVNSCPDIKFLGPENLVTPFINSFEHNLKTSGWNEDAGMCDNLLMLLGLPLFPQRDTEAEVDEIQGECSICFTLRLNDNTHLPVKVCNNNRCDSFFHIPCLAQWFQTVPTNEASFNLISGDCPSCGEKILCPITVT